MFTIFGIVKCPSMSRLFTIVKRSQLKSGDIIKLDKKLFKLTNRIKTFTNGDSYDCQIAKEVDKNLDIIKSPKEEFILLGFYGHDDERFEKLNN